MHVMTSLSEKYYVMAILMPITSLNIGHDMTQKNDTPFDDYNYLLLNESLPTSLGVGKFN